MSFFTMISTPYAKNLNFERTRTQAQKTCSPKDKQSKNEHYRTHF